MSSPAKAEVAAALRKKRVSVKYEATEIPFIPPTTPDTPPTRGPLGGLTPPPHPMSPPPPQTHEGTSSPQLKKPSMASLRCQSFGVLLQAANTETVKKHTMALSHARSDGALLRKQQRRCDAPLFHAILERGERTGSSIPLIDAIYSTEYPDDEDLEGHKDEGEAEDDRSNEGKNARSEDAEEGQLPQSESQMSDVDRGKEENDKRGHAPPSMSSTSAPHGRPPLYVNSTIADRKGQEDRKQKGKEEEEEDSAPRSPVPMIGLSGIRRESTGKPLTPVASTKASKPRFPTSADDDGTKKKDDSCSVKVAVRVRPFSALELQKGADKTAVLQVSDATINIKDPATQQPHSFTYNHVFWSVGPPADDTQPAYSSQEDVSNTIGDPLLENIVEGYNACLFSYGQTGSGKTYTMIGKPKTEERGVIPRLCENMFEVMKFLVDENPTLAYRVEAAYMEIYNEKVHDLLAPKRDPRSNRPQPNAADLKVRQHPVKGPFVEGLSRCPINSAADVLELLDRGSEARSTAATAMNERSSRSHAIFTIEMSVKQLIQASNGQEVFTSKFSKLHLVDLAGSERMGKSNVQGGDRFLEMTKINLSLSTLSRVIETLASSEQAKAKALKSGGKAPPRPTAPPYRESLLTWILSDSIGGNCKTIMCATVSPSAMNASETISTLRYASRAMLIVNKAVINEDPTTALISELQNEMTLLRKKLQDAEAQNVVLTSRSGDPGEIERLRDKYSLGQKLFEELKQQEETERLEWQMRTKEKEMELTSEKEKLQKLADECTVLKSHLEFVRQDKERKTEEVASLHTMLRDKERELQKRSQVEKDLQKSIATKEEEITLREAELRKTREERERMLQENNEQMTQMKAEFASREGALQEQKAEEAERRLALEKKAKELEERFQEREKAALEAEAQMQAEIKRRHEELQKDQHTIEQLREDKLKAIAAWQEKEAALHNELFSKESVIAQLKDERKRLEVGMTAAKLRLEQETAAWTASLEQMKADKEMMERELQAQAKSERDRLEAEVQQWKQQLEAMSMNSPRGSGGDLSPFGSLKAMVTGSGSGPGSGAARDSIARNVSPISDGSASSSSMSPSPVPPPKGDGVAVDSTQAGGTSKPLSIQVSPPASRTTTANDRELSALFDGVTPNGTAIPALRFDHESWAEVLFKKLQLLEGKTLNQLSSQRDLAAFLLDHAEADANFTARAFESVDELARSPRSVAASSLVSQSEEDGNGGGGGGGSISGGSNVASGSGGATAGAGPHSPSRKSQQHSAANELLIKALVHEYNKRLETHFQSQSEWSTLQNNLNLTIQAVSGRPKVRLFGGFSSSNSEMEEALKRQEQVTKTANQWLLSAQLQKEILKMNVETLLGIIRKLHIENAKEKEWSQRLSLEVTDLQGKFDRSLHALKRLYDQNANLEKELESCRQKLATVAAAASSAATQ